MSKPLAGRSVVLGVAGSIACYKALSVAGRLTQDGALVDVILTKGAAGLVSPLAFQALTHRPAVTSLWEPRSDMGMDHLAMAARAEVMVVAPATAHTVAQLALGLAGDALTTTALATAAQLVVAPAMEPRMWLHEATRHHARVLRGRGVILVGPVEGRLASGAEGQGRMAEPDAVVAAVAEALAPAGAMAGLRVVVTAGPTREPLDPVRFLSNHSTGRMGFAVAEAAQRRGATVQLVSGPSHLPEPPGVEVIRVERAREMRDATLALAPHADIVVLSAAVADFEPTAAFTTKLKKADGAPALELRPTPDIAVELGRELAEAARRPVLVGFAAESDDVVENARVKKAAKGFDILLANSVPEAFGDGSIHGVLIAGDTEVPLEGLRKEAAAALVLEHAAGYRQATTSRPAGQDATEPS